MVAYIGGVALAKEPVKGGAYGQREPIPMITREPISFQNLLAAVLDAGGDEEIAREIFQHPLVGFGYYTIEEALKRAGLEVATC